MYDDFDLIVQCDELIDDLDSLDAYYEEEYENEKLVQKSLSSI